MGHHQDLIAQVRDEAHIVVDHHHRNASVAHQPDGIADMVRLLRGKPGGRLVEHDDARPGGKPNAHAQDLLEAVRQIARHLIRDLLEVEPSHHLVDVAIGSGLRIACSAGAQQRGDQTRIDLAKRTAQQVLAHRLPGVHRGCLEGANEAAGDQHVGCLAGDISCPPA